MPTENVSSKIRTYAARRFKDSFSDITSGYLGYIFIGRGLPYANVEVVESISGTVRDERSIWNEMIVAKKVFPSDVEMIIPKKQWQISRIYKQYDDTSELTNLLTDDAANNKYAMYVLNTQGDVYKCISNNANSISVLEPLGTYTSSNGFISTGDGYTWKYMYSISVANKFVDNSWMPVPPCVYYGCSSMEYDMDESNVVPGTISLIVVENSGNNYIHTTSNVSYSNGQSFLDIESTSNIVPNMLVTGTGIITGTYITSVISEANRILISNPTSQSGNTYTVSTRVVIDGDGIGATATPVLSGSSIPKITVNSEGLNYSRANVIIYGSGSSANARAVLAPQYGHGRFPATELGSKDIKIISRIGDVDATEGGKIPVDISFRQYGLLVNPSKYGELITPSYANANTIVTQTLDVTVAAGDAYTQNEYVYQGTESVPSFTGYVLSQTSQVIKLTNYTGTLAIGSLLKSNTAARPVVSYRNPDLKSFTGDVLYVKNVNEVERSTNQSEDIKIIINF